MERSFKFWRVEAALWLVADLTLLPWPAGCEAGKEGGKAEKGAAAPVQGLPAAALAAAAFLIILACGSPAAATTWTVEPEGALRTIGAALEKAAPGDAIVLRGGVHTGPFTIDKPVRIVGENGPVIDGQGKGTVIKVAAPGVHIQGLTIRNSGDLLASEDCGLLVAAPEACIEENRFADVLFGIYLRQAPRCLLRKNVLASKDLPTARRGDLIRLWYSDDAILEGNRVEGHTR